MRTLIATIVLSMSVPLLAQENRPQSDLAKENRELKEYIERLEKRLGELNARQKKFEQDPMWDYFRRFGDPARPRIPSTRPRDDRFDMPNPVPPRVEPFPWRLDPPSTRPSPRLDPAPLRRFDLAPAPNAQRFRFNGQDVYVIPLQPEQR